MKLPLALLAALALSGCTAALEKAVSAADKAEEIADVRIGRITTYNDTRLELCLGVAREMQEQAIRAMDEGDTAAGMTIATQTMEFLATCRPELLLERAREVFGDNDDAPTQS